MNLIADKMLPNNCPQCGQDMNLPPDIWSCLSKAKRLANMIKQRSPYSELVREADALLSLISAGEQ
jgi:hypothetical protein